MTPPVRRALVALILVSGWPSPSLSQPSRTMPPAFDVTVERTLVSESGVVEQRGPTIRYRLTEIEGPEGRAMEIRFQATTPFPGRGPLTDPAAGYRVVMNDSGTVRLFDAAGRPVEGFESGALRGMTPRAPGEAGVGVVLPRQAADRLRALSARYGQPSRLDRARMRFQRLDGELAEEAVIDAGTGLPVEVLMRLSGQVIHRSRMTYAELPDGRYYRQRQVDEASAGPASTDTRRVTTTTTMTPAGGAR